MDLAKVIRNVPDFPKKGIQFKDITTLLKHPEAFRQVIDGWKAEYQGKDIDAIVGAEARGFIFGAALAYAMDVPFVPVRKPGKLPAETIAETFELEYGTDTLEIHTDSLNEGDKVLLVDDLLATGGTMAAICRLVERLGAKVEHILFVVELPPLQGRKKLEGYSASALVEFMIE